MKFIKSILFVGFTLVLSYFTWLIFLYLTPFLMGLSWFWLIVGFLILGGVITPLIGMIPGILAVLITQLRSYNILETIIGILIIIFFAYSSASLVWTGWSSIGLKQIIYLLIQNSTVLGVFWGIGMTLIGTNIRK